MSMTVERGSKARRLAATITNQTYEVQPDKQMHTVDYTYDITTGSTDTSLSGLPCGTAPTATIVPSTANSAWATDGAEDTSSLYVNYLYRGTISGTYGLYRIGADTLNILKNGEFIATAKYVNAITGDRTLTLPQYAKSVDRVYIDTTSYSSSGNITIGELTNGVIVYSAQNAGYYYIDYTCNQYYTDDTYTQTTSSITPYYREITASQRYSTRYNMIEVGKADKPYPVKYVLTQNESEE